MERNRQEVIKYQEDAQNLIPYMLEPDLLMPEFFPNAPEWHVYEHKVWQLGEKIRQILVKEKNLIKDNEITGLIVNIATNRNAKRGRQSFIMLLGRKQYAKYAPLIISRLDDRFVYGHVIDAILKMKIWAYKSETASFVDDREAWIRNKARKYIEKAGCYEM